MNHALAKRDEMHLGDALYQASNSCDYGSVKSIYPYPKWQILDSSKFKEFADDNLKFDENGRKFS